MEVDLDPLVCRILFPYPCLLGHTDIDTPLCHAVIGYETHFALTANLSSDVSKSGLRRRLVRISREAEVMLVKSQSRNNVASSFRLNASRGRRVKSFISCKITTGGSTDKIIDLVNQYFRLGLCFSGKSILRDHTHFSRQRRNSINNSEHFRRIPVDKYNTT